MTGKLVFFLPDSKGGVETFTNNYVKSIQGMDMRVVKYKNVEGLSTRIQIQRTGHIEQVFISFSKYATPKSRLKTLLRLVGPNDILVCNDSLELELVNFYGLKNKVVFILHGDLAHYHNTLGAYRSSVDLVLCVSHGLKNKYAPLFPAIPFGVSHPFLLDLPVKPAASREKLNCIFIGKFRYLKGADLYLQTVLSYKGPMNWTVAAIAYETDQELLDKIPSGVKIYMEQPNEKILEILSDADILIFPSRTEGFGIVVLEAMSRGVVPIVLDIPIGIPDQVVHSFNGFIIKEENWEQANAYLQQLSGDRALLDRMKNNAIGFVRENFNAALTATEFITQINAAPIRPDKSFDNRVSTSSDIVPEPIYRGLKFLYNRIKYGTSG